MSRTVIGGIVAIAIAAVTAVTYIVVTSGLNDRVRKDAEAMMVPNRLPQQAANNATLVALDTFKKVEGLAKDESVVSALRTSVDRARTSELAFQRFRAQKEGAEPDMLALVDASGNIVAMDGVNNPVAGELKRDGRVAWPGLALALSSRVYLSEIWNYPGKGLMRVGVASVVDNEAAIDGAAPPIIGAVVLAYAQSSKAARGEHAVLGAEIAYFDNGQVYATSFRRGENTEDTGMQAALKPVVAQGDLVSTALAKGSAPRVRAQVAGGSYLIAALRMPRITSNPDVFKDYPPVTAGVLVLAPTTRGDGGNAGRAILLVGGVALVLALAGMFLATRRILDQVDELEVGVNEIINGNLERTFRPVGEDLDGLANGLNVMLARLLGRPEPGEEEFDEDGNPVVPGRVEFDEESDKPAGGPDPDLAALAREPEPDYYKRVYTEYLDARRQTGHPDEVSFEGFIAKLRVNEGKLKGQYDCKAVRFRVVVKDNKVTLKPVPIF